MYHIAEKFLLDKNFTKPSYLYIAEIVGGINFTNVVENAIASMLSLTQDRKFLDKKFCQRKQMVKLAKNFAY